MTDEHVNQNKPGNPLKRLHVSLTRTMVKEPMRMLAGTVIFTGIITLYITLLGVDALVFPSRLNAVRIFLLCYGLINICFGIFAVSMVCEFGNTERTYAERVERYGKVIAPMIVLFPVFLPSWIGLAVIATAGCIFYLVGAGYKKLEAMVLSS